MRPTINSSGIMIPALHKSVDWIGFIHHKVRIIPLVSVKWLFSFLNIGQGVILQFVQRARI